MKNIIKLNETRLRQIIRESIKNAINTSNLYKIIHDLHFTKGFKPIFSDKYNNALNKGRQVYAINLYYKGQAYANTFLTIDLDKAFDIADRLSIKLNKNGARLQDYDMRIEGWVIEDGELVSDTFGYYMAVKGSIRGQWND